MLLDCKAAAMSKLPEWRNHALEVTKDMIAKWPKDFRVCHIHHPVTRTNAYMGKRGTIAKPLFSML